MANKARFVFYLEGLSETGTNVAYYNIVEHRDKTLIGAMATNECLRNGYETPVPRTPDFKKWKQEVTAKRRCSACWNIVRTQADRERHTELVHKSIERSWPWR